MSYRIIIAMRLAFAVLALVVLGATSLAADNEMVLPESVRKGLNSLKISGSASALEAWVVGSPLEKNAADRSKILGVLSAAESTFGRSTGYEIIQIFPITASTLRIYGVVLFEKGPLFVRWDCFKTVTGGWIVSQLTIDTTAENVLPFGLLYKR